MRLYGQILLAAAMASSLTQCASMNAGTMPLKNENGSDKRVYTIERAQLVPQLKGDWGSAAWQQAGIIEVNNFHHNDPSSGHRPKVRAKALYDDNGLYIIFDVEDQYVRSVAREYQDPVYQDSCVEFFVKPDTSMGYFNFEMNCSGVLLAQYTVMLNDKRVITPVPSAFVEGMRVYHSMPDIVETEITEPTNWRVEYFLPFSVLENFSGKVDDVAGKTWTANFYKCADKTSKPHWASWSPISEELNFHRPDYFGIVKFAK